MNLRISFLTAVVACISITLRFGVNAVAYEAGSQRQPDSLDRTICLENYEVKTGTIIRTEDSMNEQATFVDAVISDSYASCAEKSCAYGSAECDTTVYIEGEKDSPSPTDENCYLFKCWFEQDMRCIFSDHEGYISSVKGGFESPRITSDKESDERIETTTRPKANVRKATTTPQPTTELQRPKPTSESDEAKIPIKSTTKVPERQDEQVCMATQYRCPQSRECILKRLVCDNIMDCQDKSDEIGCNAAGGGKKPLTSKPSSHEDNQVKLPESHSGFNADMYENEILPSFIDQSDSYNERDYVQPFQLPPSTKHQSSPKLKSPLHLQSLENPRERDSDEPSRSESGEQGSQQDIQHLRSLAEKQKNRNDLFSMSSKTKESDKFPTLSKVSAVRDDVFRRCQSGRCAPEEQFGDGVAAKQTNWRMRLGHDKDNNDENIMDLKSGEAKPKIQQHPPDMDDIDDEYPVMSLSNQRGTRLGQDSLLPVTQPPKSRPRFSKPQHVNPPVKYGSVLSQYRDDDFPEQRYTDNDLFQERPVVHNGVRPRTQGNPEPHPRNHLSDLPVIPKDSDDTKTDINNVHKQPQEHSPARSDMRRPEMRRPVVKHPPAQSVTTEHPMQWLDHKEPLIGVHHPDVPNRVLKPQVDVVQSDYFPEWPVDISFLYGDSYNIGEDWTQLQDNNWHNDPAPKGVQRHSDVDDRWYDERYDYDADGDDDDQYGFYQPKQRNRGDDRLPSRSRNRYRGNGQQKTHSPGKHKDRNRNYNNGGNDARQFLNNRKQQVENEYPETGKKPYHEDVDVIQPHLATTVPTPEHGESIDEHTNIQKTTLPPNPPPPTDSNVDEIVSQHPEAEKEQELAVDMESIDTVEVAKGALFPLVVGLLLTLFLLMMVGCRLRFMNRRLRYGRMKNNAHDADYLINGMYL